jgi:type III pantothenate kinase
MMDSLLLAVDIGNTHTVLGIYRDSELLIRWRLSTSGARTEDESWIAVKMLCESASIPSEKITDVIICSVVPNATLIFRRMVETYLYFTPLIVSSELDLGLRSYYDDPRAVGADRLCNAIGGFARYGGPLIVVDFGTATTFDVVDEKGDYLGGVIAPGIETSAADLWKRAARLYRVSLNFPDRIVGQNTETSMQAGIMFGAVEMINGLVRRIKNELQFPPDCSVIATGGLASVIKEKTQSIQHFDPYLTLDGMRLVYERIKK